MSAPTEQPANQGPVETDETPVLWQSIEELDARTTRAEPREFPHDATDPPEGISRRELLQLAGATLALTQAACYRTPAERVLAYTDRPTDITPGVPLHYATASTLHGFTTGLVVECWEGRPTKIEGNPLHPASLGATGIFEQALPLHLYDMGRPRTVDEAGKPTFQQHFIDAQLQVLETLEKSRGKGLGLLLEPTASPVLAGMVDRIRTRFPEATVSSWEPLDRGNVYEGARLAFDEPLESLIDFARARVVLSLDDDFLGRGPGWLRDSRLAAQGRTPGPAMSRLYVAESCFSVTGMFADHRVRLKPSEIGLMARALLRELAETQLAPKLGWAIPLFDTLPPWPEKRDWIAAVARDLTRHGDGALVLAGFRQPPEVHAIAHAINEALGSLKSLVTLVRPALLDVATGPDRLGELTARMQKGTLTTLLITAADPVGKAPVDLGFGQALARVQNSVYLGVRKDRTWGKCAFSVPATTSLEAWGDGRAPDGTASVVQPLIAPLFGGMSELELLALYAGLGDRSPLSLLKEFWQGRTRSDGFDRQWRDWLVKGVIPDTESRAITPALNTLALSSALKQPFENSPAGIELNLLPDYKLFDGRFAANPWLQELPDPVLKSSWGNAAVLSPETARQLGVETRDEVRLELRGRSIALPAFVLPGHADGCVSVNLGWGQPGPEPMGGETIGADAYALRFSDAPWFAGGLKVVRTGQTQPLATTTGHWRMEGRSLALDATLQSLGERGETPFEKHKGPVLKLYDPFGGKSEGHRWAMGVDLNRCTGCTACVVACQAENNIPVVGRTNVGRGREMHWLRIDRYFKGGEDDPEVITQPVACVHCEAAPCEYVCPVNATVHSDEGLNEMVYNRCVGTRYCSNNCPYKVRRFNYLDYHLHLTDVDRLAANPQVTVRARGVMEKCSYCVQRIERARIDARIRGGDIAPGAIVTACQQACPTRALVFGDLNDDASEVSRWHRDRRRYDLLHGLGTRPRTAYLGRIKNPNPEV